jgi:hypothetical protein
MKTSIKRLSAAELRIMQIAWIASATETLAENLRGHTQPDVDAAIIKAVDLFVNQGEPIGQAIPKGVQHARNRILHREALMLCAAVMVSFYLYH